MKICKYIRYLDIYTEDPVKSMETIAHSVRLQGSALVSYRLQSSTRLAGQPVLQDVIPIFIVGLSVYALFYFGAPATLQRLRAHSPYTFDRVLRILCTFPA
jgi:hypothetical protein